MKCQNILHVCVCFFDSYALCLFGNMHKMRVLNFVAQE